MASLTNAGSSVSINFVATFLLILIAFVATNISMKVTYDAAKNSKNIEERGLSFELVTNFDWNSAIVREDTRKDYGERRFRVFGYIENRLYVAVMTPRSGAIHVISLRKANNREVKEHGNNQTESVLDQ